MTKKATIILLLSCLHWATMAQSKKNTVVVFMSPDCPLCQNYTLTLNELYGAFPEFEIKGIISGKFFSQQDVDVFIKSYQIKFQLEIDTAYIWKNKLGATVVPEVFVFNGMNKVLYSGRIDNWMYETGKKRPKPTSHDLKNALLSIRNNKLPNPSKTKAFGCILE